MFAKGQRAKQIPPKGRTQSRILPPRNANINRPGRELKGTNARRPHKSSEVENKLRAWRLTAKFVSIPIHHLETRRRAGQRQGDPAMA
jgi:hypothetical protein